ncbi:unnamed protein product [Spirodela intermedia]|uniref:Uncharacterized protein n=1 Tax=Spirodela intermedia TaxID=51605 RepID=A0A7I8L5G8_SPIIN|nr:unnamed protein product [Spirodela intermedia]
MDLDICFRLYALVALIDESNMDVRILHERWERSNRLSLSFMLQHVPRAIRRHVTSNTVVIKVGALVQKFTSMHYTGKRNIWEYITAMHDIVGKLNDLKITILETFLVHYILQTLPTKYDLSKVSYNTYNDEWSMNALITKCVHMKKR